MIDNFIFAKEEQPCAVCHKLTNRVEINYECFCCSDECERWLDEDYSRACAEYGHTASIAEDGE